MQYFEKKEILMGGKAQSLAQYRMLIM